MPDKNFSLLAQEALEVFECIASAASRGLADSYQPGADSFATGNTLTGEKAYRNLSGIHHANRATLQQLAQEPAIARLILEGEDGSCRVVYIGRSGTLGRLQSGIEFVSYKAPLGRLAELPVGDEGSLYVHGREQTYYLAEKVIFRPINDLGEWDSRPTEYRHYDESPSTLDSLRALLDFASHSEADELDRLLEESEAKSGIVEGIAHQVRTAMGLRDQPILDQFQGEIFRLPLASQLMIMGPPGTGKTTTLIKRLGQKLDVEFLEDAERRVAESAKPSRPHQKSWLMFSPSDLLKHYLKEAFSREQVPASDDHLRTWESFRNAVARNSLGILRSANGGRYTLRNDVSVVSPTVAASPVEWFDAFLEYHKDRMRQEMIEAMRAVSAAAPDSGKSVVGDLRKLVDGLGQRPLVETYKALNQLESELRKEAVRSKAISDDLLKKERNLLYNRNKHVFESLARHLEEMGATVESEEGDDSADDELDREGSSGNKISIGVAAYLKSLRAIARSRYLKLKVSPTGRAGRVAEFLGEVFPRDEVLLEIGQHVSYQNALRRFINGHRRYVMDAPTSYQRFRKDVCGQSYFYLGAEISSLTISGIELDAIVLSMLKCARELLHSRAFGSFTDESRFGYLRIFDDLFRNQIMVDEATDFSVLELSCMFNLTSLSGHSFFACGDFNQRITEKGVRNLDQLKWISPTLSFQNVRLVYRQSRRLNEFAEQLLRIQGGDLSSLGKVPEESGHEGVPPVLGEGMQEADAAKWISDRILEVEQAVRDLPTIAVLVNGEEKVKAMADLLGRHLDSVNLRAVACYEGKSLGEGTDVRVFDVRHIKGLEFEAVFFAGIDGLAAECPDLFDRYLYVGTTRAATYLGLVCNRELPKKLLPLRPMFQTSWE